VSLPRLLTARLCLALAALAPLAALAQSGSTPLLYEVRSATNTAYLFGTIHVGARRLYPLSVPVEQAFAAARVLALEADPTDGEDAWAAMREGMYVAPDTLASHISPQLYADLQAALPRVGLPVEFARAMKPYLLAMTIAMMEVQRLGYDPALGLDVHLAKQARARSMPIVELESMAAQMALFAGLSPRTQEAMLRVTVDGVQSGQTAQEIADLVNAWAAGDVDGIARSVTAELAGMPAEDAAALREQLYDRRNVAMAQRVAQILEGDVVHFVAVGAGHLVGLTGLPELLRARGFSVKRIDAPR
jgi:hypothetical protein